MRSMPASVRPHAAPIVGLFLVVFVVLLPSLLQGGAIGHPVSDMPDHYWGNWFFGGEILQGRWPDYTSVSHQPEGGTLWIADPVGSFLMLILRPLGFPTAWNLGLFLQLFGAALAGYWLGWTQLKNQRSAFFVGICCSCSPFAFGLLHSGLSEYAGLMWAPLFLGALLQTYSGQRHPVWPAIFLVCCTLQAFYYGVFGLLLASCLIVGEQAKKRALLFLKTALIWAVAALPLWMLAQSTLRSDTALITPQNAPGWNPERLPVIDLMSWFRPGDWVHPDTPAMGNPGILHINYLGVAFLVLAFIGWRHSKKLSGLKNGGALFVFFGLGPKLSWGGHITPVLLPMALLYWLPFSPFDQIHHPYRIAAFLIPLLALWAAEGASKLPRSLQLFLPALLLVEWLFLSPAPWPVKSTPIPDVSVYQLAPEGPVLDFPPDMTTANRHYVMAQVHHGHPIAYGVNRFLSDQLKGHPLVGQLVRCIEKKRRHRLARNRDIPAREPVVLQPNHDGQSLNELGFKSLLVHHKFLNPKESQCITTTLSQHSEVELLHQKPAYTLWKTR